MTEKRKIVLLVDDDVDFLFQKKMELEEAGYTVVTAEGRRKATEVIAQTRPDVVVLDLMMEDTDAGFVLSHEIKKKYNDLPIVMVTAVTSHAGIEFQSITQSEKSWIKADKILTKPIRTEQLIREIERLVLK